jgi:hypothetical protein
MDVHAPVGGSFDGDRGNLVCPGQKCGVGPPSRVQLRSGSAESKLQESLSARLAVHDAEAGGLGEDERGGAQIGPRAVRVTVARRLGRALR